MLERDDFRCHACMLSLRPWEMLIFVQLVFLKFSLSTRSKRCLVRVMATVVGKRSSIGALEGNFAKLTLSRMTDVAAPRSESPVSAPFDVSK